MFTVALPLAIAPVAARAGATSVAVIAPAAVCSGRAPPVWAARPVALARERSG